VDSVILIASAHRFDVAADADRLAANVAAGVGTKKYRHLRNILRRDIFSQRDATEDLPLQFIGGYAGRLSLGREYGARPLVVYEPGQQRVDANAVRPQFHCQALGEADHCPLGRGIGRAQRIAQAPGDR